MEVSARIVTLELAETFVISRESSNTAESLVVEVRHSGVSGFGEAAAISVFAAVGCLALERRLPERVLRSPVGEPLADGEPLPKPAPA